jgi:thiamine pyrophosphate-dependent acetolactate synthase large subunit-like protein
VTASDDYLRVLAGRVSDDLVVIWGPKPANEWHELRPSDANLYDVYMSGAAGFALGIALGLPHRRVICIDGDGSMLMDLPILPVIAQQNPSNLVVLVFDNEAHEAAGRVPTFTAGKTDLAKMALGAGIEHAWTVRDVDEFERALDLAFEAPGASFLDLKVEMVDRRPPLRAGDGTENKYRFIRHVERTEGVRIIKPLGVSQPG